jgi:hypothetical protein
MWEMMIMNEQNAWGMPFAGAEFGGQTVGRLVLVVERQLTDASRAALRVLLSALWRENEVTWVSGLSRASMLEAGMEGSDVFYNRDYLRPEEAVNLMPWKEVWLVAGGRVWKLAGA